MCQDIDLDFIRYPLQDEAILAFVNKLNSVGMVSIQMTGTIEELNQQDYHGKRIHIAIRDAEGTLLSSKIDLGVHKHFDIEQEDFCFDVGIDDIGASLLINSKEQMLTEKLRSILKFGAFSTNLMVLPDSCFFLSFGIRIYSFLFVQHEKERGKTHILILSRLTNIPLSGILKLSNCIIFRLGQYA